jgi:hypothetical protein
MDRKIAAQADSIEIALEKLSHVISAFKVCSNSGNSLGVSSAEVRNKINLRSHSQSELTFLRMISWSQEQVNCKHHRRFDQLAMKRIHEQKSIAERMFYLNNEAGSKVKLIHGSQNEQVSRFGEKIIANICRCKHHANLHGFCNA